MKGIGINMLDPEASNKAVNEWKERLKVSVSEVVSKEEAIAEKPGNQVSKSILDAAWDEYWEVMRSAEALGLPEGYFFWFPNTGSKLLPTGGQGITPC